MPKLTSWRIIGDLEVFEKALTSGAGAAGLSLEGKVIGHPKIADNTQIDHTSAMVGRKGDTVITRSGSEYELDDPDSKFEQFHRIWRDILAALPDLNKTIAPGPEHVP